MKNLVPTGAINSTRQLVAVRLNWGGDEPSKECTSSYAHMFDCVMFPVFHWVHSIEFSVVVPKAIYLPRMKQTLPILREFAIAVGSRKVVARHWLWLSALNGTFDEVLARARTHGITHVLDVPMRHTTYNFDRAFRKQFREAAYRNLPVQSSNRFVTFVRRGSTDCVCSDRFREARRELNQRCDCTTSRRLTNEEAVMNATKSAFARAFPRLTFVPVIFPSMLFLDQLKLLQHTQILVSAYGASLANCLYLQDDATVIELHATYRNERGAADFYRYKQLCGAKTGVRWLGYAEYEPPSFPIFGTVDMRGYARFLEHVASGNDTRIYATYDSVFARATDTYTPA